MVEPTHLKNMILSNWIISFGVKITIFETTTWKAKCPMFKAIVAGFRGKVAFKKWDTWRSRHPYKGPNIQFLYYQSNTNRKIGITNFISIPGWISFTDSNSLLGHLVWKNDFTPYQQMEKWWFGSMVFFARASRGFARRSGSVWESNRGAPKELSVS